MAFDINSKLKDIAANPEAAAVLEKHMPGMLADPRTKQGYGMSLKILISFPQSKPLKAKMPEILADLAKLP
jgi:hypothetical protein